MEDFLHEMTNAEWIGWQTYLQIDDEVQAQRLAYAIVKAFGGPKEQRQKQSEDEEVIDTTDPEFARHFQGFTHTQPQQQPRRPRQASTEILFG